MNKERFSRRAVLTRLGLGAAMLPLLSTSRVRGATANGSPKRLILMNWSNGIIPKEFYPPGDELELLGLTKAFTPLKPKVLMLGGLDISPLTQMKLSAHGHCVGPALLTGRIKAANRMCMTNLEVNANGPSVDQVIAATLEKRAPRPVPLLNVGCRPYNKVLTSFRAAGQPNVPETDPYRLFDRLFAGPSLPPEKTETLRTRRMSVIDFVRNELTAFGTRLGTEDRLKIDAHLASIREIEEQLSKPASVINCSGPSLGTRIDFSKNENYVAHVDMQLKLIETAIKCDITRVVTMEFADPGSNGLVFPFLPQAKGWHLIAHDTYGPSYPLKFRIDQWHFEKCAAFAQRMDQTSESGGSILDQSAVVVMNWMREGNNHRTDGAPFMIVGSCGGFFRTGRYVRYGGWVGKTGEYWTGRNGLAHSKLLASLCQAMDVPASDFGDPEYGGTGSLADLS